MSTIAAYLQSPGILSLTMQDAQAQRLQRLLPQHRIVQCHSETEFIRTLPEATIALTWIFRQEWFALAPQLRLVSTPAAGKDYFQVQWPAGIAHWNGAFHGHIMAETAVGMLLAMCRGILPASTTYGDQPWPRHEIDLVSRTLCGSNVAICGFGHIGRAIGERLKPFGCSLFGISAHEHHDPPAYFSGSDQLLTVDALDSILPTADHLVLVLPRTPQTDGLLSRQRLALLPPHATVSNLGRGNAVDESALCEALRQRRLGGACLDVTAEEPLPAQSPLRNCPNLWITPHSSAFTHRYMELYEDELVQRLRQWAV